MVNITFTLPSRVNQLFTIYFTLFTFGKGKVNILIQHLIHIPTESNKYHTGHNLTIEKMSTDHVLMRHLSKHENCTITGNFPVKSSLPRPNGSAAYEH